MGEDNLRAYYLRRAEESLDLASRARDPNIAGIHMDFHQRYRMKAAETDRPCGAQPHAT